jgi:uncharacterized membrane protein
MSLEGYRLVFVAVGLIGVLLIATPATAYFIHLPGGEQFSELYLLGPEHITDNYPFNIVAGQNYSVYVGVGNNLGSSAYYVLYVKFGNQTDLLSNATVGERSILQPLYEYRYIIQDNVNWESFLTFSVSKALISGNNSQINTLQINNVAFNVDKTAIWDSNSTRFKYQLLFELWIYNARSNQIEYNNRYVNLQLNLTSNAGSI